MLVHNHTYRVTDVCVCYRCVCAFVCSQYHFILCVCIVYYMCVFSISESSSIVLRHLLSIENETLNIDPSEVSKIEPSVVEPSDSVPSSDAADTAVPSESEETGVPETEDEDARPSDEAEVQPSADAIEPSDKSKEENTVAPTSSGTSRPTTNVPQTTAETIHEEEEICTEPGK